MRHANRWWTNEIVTGKTMNADCPSSCLYGSIKLKVGLQLLCVDQVVIGLDLTNLLNGKLK